MNPQNENFKRIHETNLLNPVRRNESTKQIFRKQHRFANPKPRICIDSGLFKVRLCTKDSSGFVRIRQDSSGFIRIHQDSWKQVKSFENQTTSWIYKQNLLKTARICDPRNETNPDSFRKAKNKPFWSQDLWLQKDTNPWICKTNLSFYESLKRFPHP